MRFNVTSLVLQKLTHQAVSPRNASGSSPVRTTRNTLSEAREQSGEECATKYNATFIGFVRM